jgi:hypothetical protein
MATSADQSKSKLTNEDVVDPKEITKLERSVLGAEQAPTSAALTPGTTLAQLAQNVLGPPFDAERVTLAQMRQLRKDPMIAFGLHYRKVPIARAEWFIEARDKKGVNRQVAAFTDAALRLIYARYIFQRTLCLDFGFQGIAKRFVLSNPGGVFEDATDLDENGNPKVKPIWDEGSIIPMIWKPFVALRPELTAPIWDDKTEEFNGIAYTTPTTSAAATKSRGGGGKSKQAKGILEIDIYHALWCTNQKDSEHGSIYGYPLTGYARFYWWTYNFLAGLSNRAFERLAIPPVLALHPEGSTVVDAETGATRSNWEIALEMAERLRSNSVGAVPSTMAEAGVGEASGTQRAWDFKFLETPTDTLSVFDPRFNYLNVMKLRSVWVPELAFTGGEVGRTGGNVAEQMAEVFTSSQALMMEEIVDEINRYVIPQLLLLNFPEFVNNGGRATMKSRGFRKEDMELNKQIIQLFGQADPTLLERLDMPELLRRIGLPLKDAEQLAVEREQIAQEQLQVPEVPGVTTIANPEVNPGFTSGGSVPEPNPPSGGGGVAAGFGQQFVYIQPQEEINLEFADVDEFLSGLPQSKHYTDKTVRALSVQLRRLWAAHWRRMYPAFAKYLRSLETVEFSDGDDTLVLTPLGMFFADTPRSKRAAQVAAGGAVVVVSKRKAEAAARKLVKSFATDAKVLKDLADRTATLLHKILKRGVQIERKATGIEPDFDEARYDEFLSEQVGRLVKLTHNTFGDEIRDHLVNEIREGKTTSQIADGLVSRFESMPRSKAERIARSETRDAINAATLISGEGSGIRYVRAIDGEDFDQDCADRNGKLFTVKEAWKEMRREHPNGTLGFHLMPRANFSIEYVNEMPEEQAEYSAYFDDDSSTAYINVTMLQGAEIDDYLSKLSGVLIGQNGHG